MTETRFISPMLAAAMPKTPLEYRPGYWAVEEKLDGHRLVVYRGPHFLNQYNITAWSRDGLRRVLPSHVTEAISKLPIGVYDGELMVPGKRSYGVTELVNSASLVFVVFDILELLGVTTTGQTYDERRAYLNEMHGRGVFEADGVRLTPSVPVVDEAHVHRMLQIIWARDGEGVILKRRGSRYSPGKRPKGDWVKIKALRSAVLTVIGFIASKGEIQNRGLYATVVLEDEDGYRTTVKTLNDRELAKLEAEAPVEPEEFALSVQRKQHPAVGRKLRIEYQERTPDGKYRHPRWDRWEDS